MNIKSLVFILTSLLVISNITQTHITFGMATHQNKRPYQEDRFAHHIFYTKEYFFGIYDGHGGSNVSTFLQQQLHTYLVGPYFTVQRACENAFSKAEEYSLQNYTDGSTALMVLVDSHNNLHCAWTGDTRAVLEKDGAVAFETIDHKPEAATELARIKQCGGTIAKWGVWRVGGLAIARSIGDVGVKNMCPGQVIAVPDYAKIALQKNNHFMIMASDGLWDVMSSEEAVTKVHNMLKKVTDLNLVAQNLQDEAITRGSADNITICVIRF